MALMFEVSLPESTDQEVYTLTQLTNSIKSFYNKFKIYEELTTTGVPNGSIGLTLTSSTLSGVCMLELICCGPFCATLVDSFLLEPSCTGVITVDVLLVPCSIWSSGRDGFTVKKTCRLLPLAVQGNDVSDDNGILTVKSNKWPSGTTVENHKTIVSFIVITLVTSYLIVSDVCPFNCDALPYVFLYTYLCYSYPTGVITYLLGRVGHKH